MEFIGDFEIEEGSAFLAQLAHCGEDEACIASERVDDTDQRSIDKALFENNDGDENQREAKQQPKHIEWREHQDEIDALVGAAVGEKVPLFTSMRVQIHEGGRLEKKADEQQRGGGRKRQAIVYGDASMPTYVADPTSISRCAKPSDCQSLAFDQQAPANPDLVFERGVGELNAFSQLRAVAHAEVPPQSSNNIFCFFDFFLIFDFFVVIFNLIHTTFQSNS